jgi:hypothetical protein
MSDVTRILSAIDEGDPLAAEQLLPLVCEDLRRLAAQRVAGNETRQVFASDRSLFRSETDRESARARPPFSAPPSRHRYLHNSKRCKNPGPFSLLPSRAQEQNFGELSRTGMRGRTSIDAKITLTLTPNLA